MFFENKFNLAFRYFAIKGDFDYLFDFLLLILLFWSEKWVNESGELIFKIG